MIEKDDIPKVLDQSNVAPFIIKFRALLSSEDKLAFNALVMGYYFCVLHRPNEYESFLLDLCETLPEGLNEALDRYDGKPDAIDWFSFNSKINGRDNQMKP